MGAPDAYGIEALQWRHNGRDSVSNHHPVGTRHNNNVITSKRRHRRRFDVMKTLSLRHYCVMCPLGSLTIVYSIVYSDADQRKHQSFASLAFVQGIHRGPVNCPHKWPVTRKMFPFDDVIMVCRFRAVFSYLQQLCVAYSYYVSQWIWIRQNWHPTQ